MPSLTLLEIQYRGNYPFEIYTSPVKVLQQVRGLTY